MLKHFYAGLIVAIGIAASLPSCSKDKDTDPVNQNNNTGGSTQPPGGSNSNPPPAANETINYTVEFISGPRAGTKYSGSLGGLSYGGFSATEDGVEVLYTSFYHSDTIVIAAHAVLDANDNAKPLNTSYSDDSYVNISINPSSQKLVMITSQSGSCNVSNIARGATHPGSDDVEVKRAGYTFQFEGTFKESDFVTFEEHEHTIRGTIVTKLPK